LSNFGNELLIGDGNYLWSRAETQNKLVMKGKLLTHKSSLIDVFRGNDNAEYPSCAIVGNDVMFCYLKADPSVARKNVYITSYNIVNETYTYNDVKLRDYGKAAKVVAMNGFFFVATIDEHFTQIAIDILDPSVYPVTGPIDPGKNIIQITQAVTNLDTTNPVIDLVAGTNYLYVVYGKTNGIDALFVHQTAAPFSNTNFTLGTPITLNSNPQTSGAAASYDVTNDRVMFCYSSGTGFRYTIRNKDFTSQVKPDVSGDSGTLHVKNITAGHTTAGTAGSVHNLYLESYDTVKDRSLLSFDQISDDGNTVSGIKTQLGLGLACNPMDQDIIMCLHDSGTSGLQHSLFLMSMTNNSNLIPFIESRHLYGQAQGFDKTGFTPKLAMSGTKYIIPAMIINPEPTISGVSNFKNIVAIVIDIDKQQDITEANTSYAELLGTAGVKEYDKRSVVENNFYLSPDNLSFSATAVTGGFMSDGTYLYQAMYEWVDSSGFIHRSAPSAPLSVTLSGGGSTQTASISLTKPYLTKKNGQEFLGSEESLTRDKCRVILYRYKNGLTQPFKVADVTYTIDSSLLTIVDTLADSSIGSNEVLYTFGGEFENTSPPPCSLIIKAKNRVFLINDEDPLECWFSKEQIVGEAVAFSFELTTRVSEDGGRVTALGQIDDKLVFFKKSTIFVMNGDGPTNTGSNNSFSRPTKIETDVGCVDPNSVVNTPEGLMFKSQKGIYLLSRSLTVQYIGADVEDFNQYKIKSALFLENNNQVRFTTNNGYILVYDFFFKQWSVFTYGGIDSEYVTNQFYTLQSSPVAVLRESAAFADGSSYIKMLGVTPWIKLAGIQGYQRIRRMSFLGESKGAHN